MFEVEPKNNITILDYLNADCWRNVLGYVPVLDIIRTERTSRQWQQAVLNFLQGFRFRITSLDEENEEEIIKHNSESKFNTCSLQLARFGRENEYYESFASWICKLGTSVVAICCGDMKSLDIIRRNCPNLEALTLFYMYDLPLPKDMRLQNIHDFKCLKRLSFYESYASDDCISQFIEGRALEELEFRSCYDVTGQCLNTVNLLNLKSLVFDTCYDLESSHILTCIINNKLSELTKLTINAVHFDICCDILLMVEKMFNLEFLEILHTTDLCSIRNNHPSLSDFTPLCRLHYLKHLMLGFKVTDYSVEAITRCCKDLKELELYNCLDLSSQAVEAICLNSGAHLTVLGLHLFDLLDDDDVVACISGCPKLIRMSLSGTPNLTEALTERAVAARKKLCLGYCLHLNIESTNTKLRESNEKYRDLIIITVGY